MCGWNCCHPHPWGGAGFVGESVCSCVCVCVLHTPLDRASVAPVLRFLWIPVGGRVCVYVCACAVMDGRTLGSGLGGARLEVLVGAIGRSAGAGAARLWVLGVGAPELVHEIWSGRTRESDELGSLVGAKLDVKTQPAIPVRRGVKTKVIPVRRFVRKQNKPGRFPSVRISPGMTRWKWRPL